MSDYSYFTDEPFFPNDFQYHNIRGGLLPNVLDVSGPKKEKLRHDVTPNFMAVPVADPVWQLPMYLNRDNDRLYSEKNGIFVDPNHPPPQGSTGTPPLTERSQATPDVEESKSKGIIAPSQRFSESEFVHQDNRGRRSVFCIPYDFSVDAISFLPFPGQTTFQFVWLLKHIE